MPPAQRGWQPNMLAAGDRGKLQARPARRCSRATQTCSECSIRTRPSPLPDARYATSLWSNWSTGGGRTRRFPYVRLKARLHRERRGRGQSRDTGSGRIWISAEIPGPADPARCCRSVSTQTSYVMERQRVMWCLALNRSHRWRDTITSRQVQPYGIRQISPDFTFEEGAVADAIDGLGQTWAMPPSTASSAPVVKLLSSLARKRAAAATSSGLPMRPRGIMLDSASRTS